MDIPTLMDEMETAWGVIANASDWDHSAKSNKAAKEWVTAAERWRDRYHELLTEHLQDDPAISEVTITSREATT